jgi:sugar-specific transcriptional regulator TrmB
MGDIMEQAEIVRALQGFGLVENEVEVYFFLVKTGSCPGGIVARRLGTNRMSVYRTLKTLEEKGLIESTVERPSRSVALPVVDFLNRFIEESKTRTTSLERNKGEIVGYCERLQKAGLSVEEPRFRIVQGRKHIFDQICKMLEAARKETCIVQTRNGLYRYIYAGIDDKLKELYNKGVDVKVLTQVDESGVEAVKNYLNFAQVRHAALESTMRVILVDEAEALTTFTRDDSMSLTTEKDTAMWVRASDYAKSMKVFFEAIWKDGVLARQRLAEIAEKQTTKESLDWARRTLEADGWITMIPGKLAGESGVEHSFDLVAKYPDERNFCLVVDSLSEHGSPQILAFGLKALDVRSAAQLLVTTRQANGEERELATRRGIKLIYATKSQQLAARIVSEANKILKSA